MDQRQHNERAYQRQSGGSNTKSDTEASGSNGDGHLQADHNQRTIYSNETEPTTSNAVNHLASHALVDSDWANTSDGETRMIDSDHDGIIAAAGPRTSTHAAGSSAQDSFGNHSITSRPSYPRLTARFILADDSHSEYDSEEHSPLDSHPVGRVSDQTYLPASYFSSQYQNQQPQQYSSPPFQAQAQYHVHPQSEQQQQQQTRYQLPSFPSLLSATSHPHSIHTSDARLYHTAPPTPHNQPPSPFIPLALSLHTPLTPDSPASNATYQLTQSKTFSLLHDCPTLRKAEGLLSKYFANELRALGFGGAVRVLAWRVWMPPVSGRGGVDEGSGVRRGIGKRVLRKENHEDGETPGVWWNVVGDEVWEEWVGRVREAAVAGTSREGLEGGESGRVVESEGSYQGQGEKGDAQPPQQGGGEFVAEAKAVVMMVVSKEARVKEPKKLATAARAAVQIQQGQGRDQEHDVTQAGGGRDMKRRRLSMHGDYAGPEASDMGYGYANEYAEMDQGGEWEEAIDDNDDDIGGEDVQAKEGQVGTIMIYRHEYDDLIREAREVRGLKTEVERLSDEIARLSVSLS